MNIEKPPPGCYRACCWCTWWLLANKDRDRKRVCRNCQGEIVPASASDLELAGLVEVDIAPTIPLKGKKTKKAKTVAPKEGELWREESA